MLIRSARFLPRDGPRTDGSDYPRAPRRRCPTRSHRRCAGPLRAASRKTRRSGSTRDLYLELRSLGTRLSDASETAPLAHAPNAPGRRGGNRDCGVHLRRGVGWRVDAYAISSEKRMPASHEHSRSVPLASPARIAERVHSTSSFPM